MNAPVQQFNPSQISIIDHNGGKWLTAEQLGLALGFSDKRARDGVNNLYNRHLDEFSDGDSTTIKLMAVDGKQRETRIFSHSGCNLLSFFANTPNAKAFRAWAKTKLAEPDGFVAVDRETLRFNMERVGLLEEAYLKANPEAAKLVRYHNMGLDWDEKARLMGVSKDALRHRLKELDRLGIVAYAPDPKFARAGRLGCAARQQKRAMLEAQQSLGLEG
ncbi:BRO-N domain-containing protein [Bergeriella denitrificans]|uniref:Phage anti-repressor protein n=1 Tax=Bergeriella denitrificans TaxID=494 RepID=A0A378UGC8_BERDE|nr:Bro-N domain-containing protein [Bergeriella denitrificans]STZ76355.1 phage anti-repressor protein [Bergeriella denitrificans]